MVQQQEDADHLTAEHFFRLKGLIAERIPETVIKTPDFKVRRDAEVVAFCEVKSPQNIFEERVNNAITSGRAGVIEIGYGNDYRQARCIERAAQKAAPQFDAANPSHSVPNILMVVNHDAHADVEDFVQELTGTFQGRPAVANGGIQNAIPQIDCMYGLIRKTVQTNLRRALFIITIADLKKPLARFCNCKLDYAASREIVLTLTP
jgi:hypothetical protein